MTEPTDAELDELRQANSGRLNFVTLSEFRTIARAVLAKWGTPPVPAGYALVPVNPTPEMWKAAKSVPDPNPPYPPHYGLVWDAMLAASPTPQPAPATQQAGGVVAYLDVGASGYLDLGSALSDEALQQLPKGRHALVIAGTYGIDGYVAAPQPSPMAQAAESVPAIQGEMNVQLDIDSNHSAPGQQRDVARSVALGQPMGHGPNQVAGHLGAQGDKLLTVAERNIRSFLRSAHFKSESDREAALNCVDVLWAAACAPADSVLEDAGGANWQDISTAPKDGTRFVAVGNNYGLYSEMQHTCIAQWFRGCWMEASDWNETSELKYLTHWMPLPPLPGNAARKQGANHD